MLCSGLKPEAARWWVSQDVSTEQCRPPPNLFDCGMVEFNEFFNGPIPAYFCLFLSFSPYKLIKAYMTLCTQTQGGRMEGTDKSTELWRHPKYNEFFTCLLKHLSFLGAFPQPKFKTEQPSTYLYYISIK